MISLVLIGECREQMPVRNALQIHVLIEDAVCLVSLLGNNVIKKCVHSHISTRVAEGQPGLPGRPARPDI